MRLTNRPLPSYSFIPGITPHPLKSRDGHMYGEEEPELEKIEPSQWMSAEDYLYSLDLLNLGYFWESHVWLEALWNAHERTGECAEFFKGLIKVAAAGVKARQGKVIPAQGHLNRAKELFKIAFELNENKEPLLGFHYIDLESFIDSTISNLDSFCEDKHRERRCLSPLIPKN